MSDFEVTISAHNDLPLYDEHNGKRKQERGLLVCRTKYQVVPNRRTFQIGSSFNKYELSLQAD